MLKHKMDLHIMFGEPSQQRILPQASAGKWSLKSDTSVLITDQHQSASHRKIIRVSVPIITSNPSLS